MKRPTVSHYAQYFALRAAVAVLSVLGVRRAGMIGGAIGRLGYWPFGIRRAVVERQVRAAFPGLSIDEVQRISRESYDNLGRTAMEAAVLPAYSRAETMGLFEEVNGWEIIDELHQRGLGVMIVSAHLGNWELGGAYASARLGSLDVVARGMENPLFDGYLTRTRERLGLRVVHDRDAVRRVPRALREGHAVAFLIDQGAAGLASTWVPFFGRHAKTPRGPAVFALRLDVAVVFACSVRLPNGYFALHFEEVQWTRTGDRERDVDGIVAAYTSTLERWVRRYPGQYFWQHRRWKHQRPGTPPELGDPS